MKYLVRAVKYFFYFTILLAVILAVFVLLGFVEADPDTMFRNGTASIRQILLLFAIVAAFYPKLAYASRPAVVPGEFRQIREGIVETMKERGYELEKEEGENLSFRSASSWGKISRMWEDRITFTRRMDGYDLEGPNKDLLRITSALENRFAGNME